jgi:uncharacterized protein
LYTGALINQRALKSHHQPVYIEAMQNLSQPDTRPVAAARKQFSDLTIPGFVTNIIPSNNLRFGMVFGIFFVVPYAAMWAIKMPETYKYILITLIFIVSVGYSYVQQNNLKELGLRFDTLKKSMFWHGLLIAAFTSIIYLSYFNNLYRLSSEPDPSAAGLVFYFFISCPVQEFLYRSFLFSEMKRASINNFWVQIFVSGLAFSIFHIHREDIFTLAVTLFVGILWGIVYHKHPNFFSAALAHSTLGMVALLTKLV